MGSPLKLRSNVNMVLAVLSTALLVWFGTGLSPFWPLVWFAPVPILLLAAESPLPKAAVAAFVAWLLGSFNMWHYFHDVLHIPLMGCALIFAGPAFVFSAAVLLYRNLLRRGAVWMALLSIPAAWVSFEYLLNLSSPHGTVGSLSYSQLNFLPILQFASVGGPWGISFLLMLVPSAISLGIHLRPAAPKTALRIVSAVGGMIAAVAVFGALRLAHDSQSQKIRVGLIASDIGRNFDVAKEGSKTKELLTLYANEAAKLSAQGAQFIVLPEKIGVAVDPNLTSLDDLFQGLADKTRSKIVVGIIHVSSSARYNQARVYVPAAPAIIYDKHHMLPEFESSLTPGKTLTLLPRPAETVGIAICKDMDFTRLSRQYGRAGAGLMLVPAWDFDLDRAWHGHMALMRAVESGFGLVRSAKQGYLTVSDNRGRILAETRSDSAPFASLLTDVPTVHDTTVYLLLGDWVAWGSLVFLGIILVSAFKPQNENTRKSIQRAAQ